MSNTTQFPPPSKLLSAEDQVTVDRFLDLMKRRGHDYRWTIGIQRVGVGFNVHGIKDGEQHAVQLQGMNLGWILGIIFATLDEQYPREEAQ